MPFMAPESPSLFAQKLRARCEGRIKTDIDAAAGLRKGTVSLLLHRGNVPPPTEGIKLAQALGVDPLWLLNEEDQRLEPPEVPEAQQRSSLEAAPTFDLMCEVARRYLPEAAGFVRAIVKADATVWEGLAQEMIQQGSSGLDESNRKRLALAIRVVDSAEKMHSFDPSWAHYLMPHMGQYRQFQTEELSIRGLLDQWDKVSNSQPMIYLIVQLAKLWASKLEYEQLGLKHRTWLPDEEKHLIDRINEQLQEGHGNGK